MRFVKHLSLFFLCFGCQAIAQNPDQGKLEESPASRPVVLSGEEDAPLKIKRAAPVPRKPTPEELSRYAWLSKDVEIRTLEETFPPPEGFTRVSLPEGSFGAWLRGLPLRPEGTPVYYYNGAVAYEASHPNIAAVVEIDIGKRDLHQCADSIIRLHAEWRWSQKDVDDLAYHFTSGDLASWSKYASGVRAKVSGSKVSWVKSAKADSSRQSFRSYLDLVFTYAGTLSLSKNAKKVERDDLRVGDFFVMGGSPGHAVLILDIAENAAGEKVALLGQGFLPARDVHVLSPANGAQNPWFSLSAADGVDTPFWETFPWSSLRRL